MTSRYGEFISFYFSGLYTSGRSSPVSVTQSENVRYRRNRDSDSESGHRKK